MQSDNNSIDAGFGVRIFIILFVSAYILFVFFYTARFPGINEALQVNWPYAFVCALAGTGYLLYVNRMFHKELMLSNPETFREYLSKVKIKRVRISGISPDEYLVSFGLLSRPVKMQIRDKKLILKGPGHHIRQLEDMFTRQHLIDG